MGDFEGRETLGDREGSTLGWAVGLRVGSIVVGSSDGLTVGESVGEDVVSTTTGDPHKSMVRESI